jgi:tRNA (guanine-N7-)-methyltransferase
MSNDKMRQAAQQRVAATRKKPLTYDLHAEREEAVKAAEAVSENVSETPSEPEDLQIITHRELMAHPAFLSSGWQAWAPETRALHVEIGCGYGHFLEWLAPRRPNTSFLGLDIVSRVLRKAKHRLGHIPNVTLAKLDALYTLRELVAPVSLESLYILFPDPWFKERHQKRRTLREDTLPLFASRLQLGGQLIFVSDDPPYAADALALLEASPYFERDTFPEITVKTKYENKWLAQEKPIHRYAYRRVEHADFAGLSPEWKDLSLPLAGYLSVPSLTGEALEAQLPTEQMPITHHTEHFTLKLQRIYTAQHNQDLLIQGVVAEPHTLAQAIWLQIDTTGKITVPDFAPFPYAQRRQVVFDLWCQWLNTLLAPPTETTEGSAL